MPTCRLELMGIHDSSGYQRREVEFSRVVVGGRIFVIFKKQRKATPRCKFVLWHMVVLDHVFLCLKFPFLKQSLKRLESFWLCSC